MLPSQVAGQVRRSVVDYLQTTFAFTRGELREGLERFLQDPERGLFKGPYLSVRLPYKKAPASHTVPLDVAPPFVPFVHQLRSFERLASREGHEPLHTLVTTGTGSGKTECFLYPLLDHCVRHQGQPGIKAIVLYPMNALATDQARRIASILAKDNRVRGKVRVGLYIGGSQEACEVPGKDEQSLVESMLLTDRQAIRAQPPDILLTNYRMLDFLLLRPEDSVLWKDNGPRTLRYLVLDELHTYDGAQGSDVSCLIRRLRARLGIAPQAPGLTCVGTSATVVSGDDASEADEKLLSFAGQVFGTPFPRDAIIKEEREGLNAYLRTSVDFEPPPYPRERSLLEPRSDESLDAYCQRQAGHWLGPEGAQDRFAAAEYLRGHPLLPPLVRQGQRGVRTEAELCERLAQGDPEFEALPPEVRLAALDSFVGVISWARRKEGKYELPLLTVQVHLWLRELRRLLRRVHAGEVAFCWPEERLPEGVVALPTYYCRECGHAGWVSVQHQGDRHLSRNPKEIFRAYFERSEWLRYVALGDESLESDDPPQWLNSSTLELRRLEDAPAQGGFKVHLHHHVTSTGRDSKRCPACDTDQALIMVGAQGSTLNSVSVAQFFSSRLTADKKLLAFTDSVQDASHQAGFFTGRTYRFSLRAAFLQALPEQGHVPLAQVGPLTVASLDERLGVTKATATLFAPERRDEPAYRSFLDRPTSQRQRPLEQALQERVSIEAVLEFGYNARVGRSLYKVGSAALSVDPDALERAAGHLAHLLPNELPGLFSHCDDPGLALRRLLLSLQHRVASRGGVHHPVFDAFLRDGANDFLLRRDRNPALPPLPLSERPLRFLSRNKKKRTLDLWAPPEPHRTWAYDFALRALVDGPHPLDDALSHDRLAEDLDLLKGFFGLVQDRLVAENLLRDYGRDRGDCLGIPLTALRVTRDVRMLRCGVCGHPLTLDSAEARVLEGGRCLGYRCIGRYQEDTRPEQRYYRAVYASSDIQRVFAQEHTGLLSRTEREAVETGFKEGKPADAPNLLSATPTLEMGINVGDLSGTLLASVPPTVANFVQRAGRAGRDTGNALLLTLARAQSHDLYFFLHPPDMIAGAVTAPGTFLDAPEMLIRQFNAFCLDQWARGEPRAVIPRNVAAMLSAEVAGRFPRGFLEWVGARRTELLGQFQGMFGDALSEPNRARLQLAAGELGERLGSRLRQTRESIEELQRLRLRLKERQRALLERPDPNLTREGQEQERQELETDLRVVEERLRGINNQWGLDYLVANGFLPNYALAEPGVTLSYVITGVPGAEGTRRIADALERPAARALRELAPFNSFYARGRKLVVDQVRAGTRDHSRIERWAFCTDCAHTALWTANDAPRSCEVCGAEGFGQQGQVREVLRLQEVAARQPHHSSIPLDDTDERAQERYRVLALFELDPARPHRAWADSERVFGFEWLASVRLRELNLGLERERGPDLELQGDALPAPGFSVCDDCGIVRDRQHANHPPRHLFRCRSKTGGERWRDVFLYREMHSEAIRVLLPVVTFDVESRMRHLKACLRLGLREKFGGAPVHLQVDEASEPTSTGARRRFLVLYDNVEGGTGYLKEFAEHPTRFLELFELARRRMRACPCSRGNAKVGEPPGDGCHRCLFSGAEGRQLEGLSKRAALELIAFLLQPEPDLREVASLSDISVEPVADSELEEMFLSAALQDARSRGFTAQRVAVRGLDAWRLERCRQVVQVVRQVPLGREQGVEIASRPDFVFEAVSEPDGAASTRLPVAVFCDGYRFHARLDGGDSIIHEDVAKRAALVRSGRYRVWSTTWADVDGPELARLAGPELLTEQAASLFSKLPFLGGAEREAPRRNPVLLLLDLITELPEAAWTKLAAGLSAALLSTRSTLAEGGWESYRADLEARGLEARAAPAQGRWGYGEHQAGPVRLSVCVDLPRASAELSRNPGVLVRWVLHLLDHEEALTREDFRDGWRLFWALFNWMQVLPEGEAQTSRSLERAVDGTVRPRVAAQEAPSWVAEVDPSISEIALALARAVVPLPELLSELARPGSTRGAWGQAELSWPERRAALLLEALAPEFDVQDAQAHGWKLWVADAALDVQSLIDFLKESR
ncbi:DEAD/DEAH box helicase [Myxococcus virescens]|uniref:DEAD/DEAH box helicase n=1 Tax=Myxococcus virescens TaxID=83456 RepID=A0A511H567_9BACT|nr:DEAD/DEAH box helicase [Myxococcus virescens]GEL68671.1 DEAD/DEAH box helicase [Myxococcus virescens]SDE49790.1 DEAD/DEAH box helicase domain-containing protein [Myxococcus virescens]